jgi:ABC-type transporter lipoprotein component MlaA
VAEEEYAMQIDRQRMNAVLAGALLLDGCASLPPGRREPRDRFEHDAPARLYDPYVFVRNAWWQRREYEVRNGNVPPDPAPGVDEAPKPEEK